MTRVHVWCHHAVGAVQFLLRRCFPALTWFLSVPLERRALMAELQRMETDPEFAAAWRAALDDELRQMRFNRAVDRLLRQLSNDSDSDSDNDGGGADG